MYGRRSPRRTIVPTVFSSKRRSKTPNISRLRRASWGSTPQRLKNLFQHIHLITMTVWPEPCADGDAPASGAPAASARVKMRQ